MHHTTITFSAIHAASPPPEPPPVDIPLVVALPTASVLMLVLLAVSVRSLVRHGPARPRRAAFWAGSSMMTIGALAVVVAAAIDGAGLPAIYIGWAAATIGTAVTTFIGITTPAPALGTGDE